MTEIKGACPSHEGDTSGSDSYVWNDQKQQGYCFSCGLSTWVHQETGDLWGKRNGHKFKVSDGSVVDNDRATMENDLSHGMEDVVEGCSNPPAVENDSDGEYKPWRGISVDTMKHFGVTTKNDKITFVYPSGGTKTRGVVEKVFYANGFKSDELFGMNLFPPGCSKKVTITEGEGDCLSAWQMLRNGNYINPVVSLPSATPAGKLWEKCKGWIDSFDEIILSVDNDEPGRKVAEVMFDLFPGKVYIMDHGQHKDANDFLMNGDAKAYKSAWWKAKKYSPAGFTASIEDWMEAIDGEDPYEYTPTPIKGFNEIAKGLVKGGITVVKAPPGTGKSSYLRMLMHDLVVHKKATVACLMMEEVKSVTGRAMATYELGKNVKTKEDADFNGISEEQVKAALSKVLGEEKFVSFDVNPQDPVEDCLRQCKYAISIYNADFIFIDHLQRLAYLSGTDGATAALTELGVKLTELAKRKNVGIICISHVNSENRTKYAASIEEEAIVLIEMKRDKKAEDTDERNTTYLEVSKNRPYAVTGPAGMLTYDIETDMVTEKLGPVAPVTPDREDF